MKIAKRAKQNNIELNIDHYTEFQIEEMMSLREIFFLNDNIEVSFDFDDWRYNARRIDGYHADKVVRLGVEDLVEIKVALDEGMYTNVAIGKNGVKYFVNL